MHEPFLQFYRLLTCFLLTEKYLPQILDAIRIDYDVDQQKNVQARLTEVSKEDAEKAVELQKSQLEGEYSIFATGSCGSYSGYDCYEDSSWIRLESWISKYAGTKKGKVSTRAEWLTNPWHKKIDVIAIGLNSNLSPIPGTESAVYKYEAYHTGQGKWLDFDVNYSTAHKRDIGGYGYNIQLNSAGRKHRVYMEYQFTANVSNVTTADAYTYYAHQERTIQIVPSFSITSGGSLNLDSPTSFSKIGGHVQFRNF